MINRAAEHGYRIKVLLLPEHFIERIVGSVATVDLPQTPAPSGPQIRDCGDLAVRMLMKVKLGAKAASHDPQPNLLSRGGRRGASDLHRHQALSEESDASGAE